MNALPVFGWSPAWRPGMTLTDARRAAVAAVLVVLWRFTA